MYLLIQSIYQGQDWGWFHLHSIMYLLILLMQHLFAYSLVYLHSIMYLLIPARLQIICTCRCNLHSIMYLLIQEIARCLKEKEKEFTFHNVSINSLRHPVPCRPHTNIYIP